MIPLGLCAGTDGQVRILTPHSAVTGSCMEYTSVNGDFTMYRDAACVTDRAGGRPHAAGAGAEIQDGGRAGSAAVAAGAAHQPAAVRARRGEVRRPRLLRPAARHQAGGELPLTPGHHRPVLGALLSQRARSLGRPGAHSEHVLVERAAQPARLPRHIPRRQGRLSTSSHCQAACHVDWCCCCVSDVTLLLLQGDEIREGNNPSWFNTAEALLIVEYLQQLLNNPQLPDLQPTDVGVITPYRKQVRRLMTSCSVDFINMYMYIHVPQCLIRIQMHH